MKGISIYSIVFKKTGQVLASHLTLAGVESWLTSNEFRFESFRFIGTTVEVAELL